MVDSPTTLAGAVSLSLLAASLLGCEPAPREGGLHPAAKNGAPSAADPLQPATPNGQPVLGADAAQTSETAASNRSTGGGSSGVATGAASSPCVYVSEQQIPLDMATRAGSGSSLRDHFERAISRGAQMPLRWTPEVGGTTTLTIQAIAWGTQATLRSDAAGTCERLTVPVTLHVTTADGLLDDEARAEVDASGCTAELEVSSAQGQLARSLRTALQRDSLALKRGSLALYYGTQVEEAREMSGSLGLEAMDADDPVAAALTSLGAFDSTWPRGIQLDVPARAPDGFASLCATASATSQFTGAGSASELQTALTGRWVLCSGTGTGQAPHAGLEVTAQGGWTYLAADAAGLRELPGFGREGTARVQDSLSALSPGVHQVDFQGWSSARIDFSSDGKTMTLESSWPQSRAFRYTYVATDAPVLPAQLGFPPGARAGAAACDKPEAEVSTFTSAADLRTGIAGTWSVCTGYLCWDASALRFTADGHYERLDAQRRVIGAGSYTVDDGMPQIPDDQSVWLTDDSQQDRSIAGCVIFRPELAGTPRKLRWRTEDSFLVLSAAP